MSESDGEKAARSVALEQAYVHDVYEQCAEKTAQSRHWPRIYKFLEELEPGALVCDIGCGNGKYLSVNNNVFKVGADRCKRLTDIAREKENEVLICDNLALPFRDESFDAVLSIAVVHHFATTERRVNALKELARVLRIGGRLVISVWAMEQRHRKFESQDVLVPWPKAYYLNSDSSSVCPGGKSSASGMPCISELDSDRIAQKCLLTSKRNGGRKCKNRGYWIDPIFSPSPSTSSLSSPNETCYSFFRRALQKLAGGKRGSGNRAWFLENWQNGGCKNRRNYESDDIGDVDDIPIELRRLEDDNVTFSKLPDALSVKSKSLGDILEIQRLDLVRSRSSIPGFSSTVTSELYLDEESKTPSPSPTPPPPPPPPPPTTPPPPPTQQQQQHSSIERTRLDDPRLEAPKDPAATFSRSFSTSNKPRLVKQKTHIPDDATLEFPEKPQNTAIREMMKDLADIQKAESLKERRRNVHKQSSMNEELMSMERLIERDRVRRNIMKQASLNEEIICKPSRAFGNFRDSLLYSGNATKRFQLIKSGLTNRIKQSTTSMEKVSSLAIKNGFVKILQGWTSGDDNAFSASDDKTNPETLDNGKTKDLSPKLVKSPQSFGTASTTTTTTTTTSASGKSENEPIERRLSREDGSDSSKDSSLQSDTSVDSEDSFASVIYVPKQQQQQRLDYHNPYQQQSQQQQQQQHHNRIHQQNSKHNHQNHHFPSLIDVATVPVGCYQLRTTSAPPSPRIKHPPDGGHGPRLKLISISPLLKQFPATSKSLPPPSPPGLSPRNLYPFSDPRPFFPPSEIPSFESLATIRPFKSPTDATEATDETEKQETLPDVDAVTECEVAAASIGGETEEKQLDEAGSVEIVSEQSNVEARTTSSRRSVSEADKEAPVVTDEEERKISEVGADAESKETETTPTPAAAVSVANLESGDNRSEKSSSESINDDDSSSGGSSSRRTRLNQIKELLRQKPGFATRCAKSSFPLVRRASTATSGRPETIEARTLPRLLSLELYNPETDDLDSDSSGLSSPESVGSVISVISDERFALKKDLAKAVETEKAVDVGKPETRTQVVEATKFEEDSRAAVAATKSSEPSSSCAAVTCGQSARLLEAAASVVNSLQDTVDTAVIRLEPHQCRGYGHNNHAAAAEQPTSKSLAGDAGRVSRVQSADARGSRISRRTRERLDSMPEETSGNNIISDIERYCRSARLLEDPAATLADESSAKTTIGQSPKEPSEAATRADNSSIRRISAFEADPVDRPPPGVNRLRSTDLTDEAAKTTIGQSPKEPNTTTRLENSSMITIPAFEPDPRIDLLPGVNRLRSNCKYSQLVDDTIAWLRGATGPENDDYREYSDNNENPTTMSNDERRSSASDDRAEVSLRKSLSEDIMDFVMVSDTGECISMAVSMEIGNDGVAAAAADVETSETSKFDVSLENSLILEKYDDSTTEIAAAAAADGESSESSADNKTDRETCVLRYGDSVESTEIDGCSVGNSASLLSDASQAESLGASRFRKRGEGSGNEGGSTNSLGSSGHEYKTLRERRKYLYQKRSASEEVPSRDSAADIDDRDDENSPGAARHGGAARRGGERSLRTPNLSASSSQESLLSDRGGSAGGGSGGGSAGGGGGGGAITYHQYYHVFREGELDQLINKYVENLHIISSYYDHASWCIVAEKVQVWTI